MIRTALAEAPRAPWSPASRPPGPRPRLSIAPCETPPHGWDGRWPGASRLPPRPLRCRPLLHSRRCRSRPAMGAGGRASSRILVSPSPRSPMWTLPMYMGVVRCGASSRTLPARFALWRMSLPATVPCSFAAVSVLRVCFSPLARSDALQPPPGHAKPCTSARRAHGPPRGRVGTPRRMRASEHAHGADSSGAQGAQGTHYTPRACARRCQVCLPVCPRSPVLLL
mmetsp:Transcript_1071/g.2933  ORF Transcript_1071/g.2933 Transcript_1071/m.2933 type:complete len:225 (+) Transcript_1071:1325-1999(+)